MDIIKYLDDRDETSLMQMIREEDGWDYADQDKADTYKKALNSSITYVAYNENVLCGYSRSMDDGGICIFVCDLLVKPEFRGKHIGKQLMECIHKDYPDREVYVLSGVDCYYEKVQYKKVGSIFEVP